MRLSRALTDTKFLTSKSGGYYFIGTKRQTSDMRILLLLLFLPILLSCRRSEDESMLVSPDAVSERVDVLALGDSYTKGEGVKWEQNFPNQLADSLRAVDVKVTGVHVVAQTGWRTDNLK